MAKVLELQLQYHSFQWIFRTDSFRINWISLQSKWLSRIFCNTIFEKHLFFGTRLFFWSNSHIHIWMLEKIIALTKRTFVGKIMSLLFNILSRFVITFLPRSKHLLILAAVTICSDFGAQENKVCHCFHYFPIYLPWSDGPDTMIFFDCWILNQLFHSPLSLSSRGSLVLLHFLP